MLANLERSTEPALVRSINENAVRFYAKDSPKDHANQAAALLCRTEEIYHRLRLNQSPEQLDARWSAEAARPLRAVLPEFPPQARAYLRRKLGAATAIGQRGSDDSSAVVMPSARIQPGAAPAPVGLEPEIEELRLLARHQLQSGDAVDSILQRWKADQMRLDVPLGDIYAEALLRAGWHEPLLSGARELLTGTRAPVQPKVLSAVMSVAAGLLEGRSALSDAQPFWLQALKAADQGTESTTVMACLVGSIRIRRKLNTGSALRERDFERAVSLVEKHTAGFSERRVLAREVSAELGEALVDRRRQLPGLVRLITFVAEVNEAFPSALNNPDRVEQISSRLFGIQGNRQLRSMNSLLGKLVYSGGQDMQRVVDTLREEVDWTLAQAATRPLAGVMVR